LHAFRLCHSRKNRNPYFNAYAWSARVPLDPLLAREISSLHAAKADAGVTFGYSAPSAL
jgi:hypothetical protein